MLMIPVLSEIPQIRADPGGRLDVQGRDRNAKLLSARFTSALQ